MQIDIHTQIHTVYMVLFTETTRTLSLHHKSILLKFYNSVFCFLSAYEATSQSHAVLSMSKKARMMVFITGEKQTNAISCPVHQKYFPSYHIYIILSVGRARRSPQTIEETEMNGNSHGIVSQCGVFEKALPNKWTNRTMIFCFYLGKLSSRVSENNSEILRRQK